MDEIQTVIDKDTANSEAINLTTGNSKETTNESTIKQDTETLITTFDKAKMSEKDVVGKSTKLDEKEDQPVGKKDTSTKDDQDNSEDNDGMTNKLETGNDNKDNNDKVVEEKKLDRPPQRKDMLSYAIERVSDKEFLTPYLNLKPDEQEELESYQLPSHLFQLGYAIRRPTAKTYGEVYVDEFKNDIISIVEEGIPNQNLFGEHILKKLHEKYPKQYRFPSQYIIIKEHSSSVTHRNHPKTPSNERKTVQQKTTPMRDVDENIFADFSDDIQTPIQTPKKNRSTRFWKLEENQDIVTFIEETIADMIRFDEKCRIPDVVMRVKERFPDRSLPNDNVLKNKVGSLHARVIRTPELDTGELKSHFHSS